MNSPVGRSTTTWIFQANPDRYDIERSLQKETLELWNCMQHATRIKAGDRVLVWISGRQAGIYAIGEVISDPVAQPDSIVGQRYWRSAAGRVANPRVEVRYQRILLDRPLLKTYLTWDPALSGLQILRQPRGTNFPVLENEWAAIAAWLEE